MAKEIERKFRVVEAKIPPLADAKHSLVERHYIYLGIEDEVRIRRKGNKFFITAKGDGTLERKEWEKEISEKLYYSLVPGVLGRTVVKDRYEIELADGKIAELDIYRGALEGADHVTVEVEFGSREESEVLSKSEWFGEDITEDKRFKNKNLATKGWPIAIK